MFTICEYIINSANGDGVSAVYEIVFTKRAVKELKSIAPQDASKIMDKIKELSINQYNKSFNIKKLKGFAGVYRLRVGEYRVIYEINNNTLLITIVKVETRGRIYGEFR